MTEWWRDGRHIEVEWGENDWYDRLVYTPPDHRLTTLTLGRTTDAIPTYYIVCSNHHYLRQYGPAPFIVGFYAHLEAQEINLSLPPRQAAKVIMNLPCILFPVGVHWDCSWRDCPGNGPRASLNLEEEPTQRRRQGRIFHPIWNRLGGPARENWQDLNFACLHTSIKCWLMVPAFIGKL